MQLSIIIPSYNTLSLLKRCLASVSKSLQGQGISYEVLVVDNNSSDGSAAWLNNSGYPEVTPILNAENVGYGKANNQAFRRAKGEYTLLLNSDILVLDHAIPRLLAFARSHPTAFIGGKLLNEDKSPQASCGPMYTLPVVFLMLFCKGDRLGITRSSPTTIQSADWVSGACIISKRDYFQQVGLFDEGIFMYMEEIDFLYRAKQKGYTILFYPEAVFIHTGAASSGNARAPVANIYKGLVYFYRKHYPPYAGFLLHVLLRAKARIAIAVSYFTGDQHLRSIYEKGLSLVA